MSDSSSEAPSAPDGGLFGSLRRLLATMVGVVQSRLELLTTEIEEELHRAADFLLWCFVVLVTGAMALFMLGVVVIIAFWENRLVAAASVTTFFVLAALIAAWIARSKFKESKGLLSTTRDELKKDLDALEGR
jgi:uncharacterized membrane protein YqjE